MQRVKKLSLWAVAVLAMALAAGLATSTGAMAASAKDKAASSGADKAASAASSASDKGVAPQPDEFGVVEADQWADVYPDQYESYEANAANSPDSGKHNYLELYPALNTMYKGYGFAKGYDEASSHLYTLESVTNTPRVNEKTLANCISCKTPQFTATVNAEGDQVYQESFHDLIGQYTEPVSCYNCHENDPTTLKVTNGFFKNALGDDADKVPVEAEVCGQCHNEYYFNPETKATTNPYTGLDQMTPDAILKYYNDMGFSDWTHPDTDAKMIKVQHPEFETLYGGDQASMAKAGYSCADCHMAPTADAEGNTYASHDWESPLDNEDLLKNNCSKCHEDLTSEVRAIQQEEETRVIAISEKIENLVNQAAAQKADGSLAGDDLAKVQDLQRTAQFYWDFVMVENSEGAHNPDLAFETLDKAEAAVDEGLELLK